VFITNARRTRGWSSGGFVCYIRRNLAYLSPVYYHSSEHFQAARLGDSVLINATHDKKLGQSFSSLAESCGKLQGLISGIESQGY